MKSEKEIVKVIKEIDKNHKLTYSYREDVINILQWVLGGNDFYGMITKKEKE